MLAHPGVIDYLHQMFRLVHLEIDVLFQKYFHACHKQSEKISNQPILQSSFNSQLPEHGFAMQFLSIIESSKRSEVIEPFKVFKHLK